MSRVGGDAQISAMKSVAGTLKTDLAQFRDLEAFATFGSELDRVSQAQLDRGYRLTELLKQRLNSPVPVEEQVISIFSGTRGFLDDIPVDDVGRFEGELIEFVRSRHADLLDTIRDTSKLPPEESVADAINEFKRIFSPQGPERPGGGAGTGGSDGSEEAAPERPAGETGQGAATGGSDSSEVSETPRAGG